MANTEEEDVGFDEELSAWLPSHFLDEPISETKKCHNKNQYPHLHHYRSLPFQSQQQQHLRPRPYCRTKYPMNWASGGSGMQAVFLDSGKKSCGTGVFLPRRAGTNLQSSKKPVCSPVLLPARVVHALNLNVHELGLQISRRQDIKSNSKVEDCDLIKSRNSKEAAAQCCVVAQNENPSSEIFLPKEWTYYY